MQIERQVHLKRSIHEIAALLDKCVILDTETTRMYGEVIDIAIIDGATGTVLFNSLIHPTTEKITEEATAVHGIRPGDTWDKPTFELVWPRIEEIIGERWIVTYNAKFDRERIVQSAMYNQKPLPQLTWLCAMEAYAAYWKEPDKFGRSYKWQKLEVACAQQGVELNGAHRALADAMATYQLIKAVAAKGAAAAQHERPLQAVKGVELIDIEKGPIEL